MLRTSHLPPAPISGLPRVVLYKSAKYDLTLVEESGNHWYALSKGVIERGKEVERFAVDADGWREAWTRLNSLDASIRRDSAYDMALANRAKPSFETRVEQAARSAWEAGRTFYVLRVDLGGTVAGFTDYSDRSGQDPVAAREAVERVGWRLESSGYLYQPLGEQSHMLTASSHSTGNIVGIYTFRRQADATA